MTSQNRKNLLGRPEGGNFLTHPTATPHRATKPSPTASAARSSRVALPDPSPDNPNTHHGAIPPYLVFVAAEIDPSRSSEDLNEGFV